MLKIKYVFFLSVFITLTGCSNDQGINVVVLNNSGKTIKDVELVYKGGKEGLGELKKGEVKKGVLSPNQESSLEINVILNETIKINSQIDTYFERGYEGDIYISIDPKLNSVLIKQEIKAS